MMVKLYSGLKGICGVRLVVALMICSISVLMLSGLAGASQVESVVEKNIQLGGSPLDMAFSPFNRLLFVLIDNGVVNIYSQDGSLKGSVNVNKSCKDIEVSPDGSILYATDSQGKSLQIMKVDFIAKFDLSGSPTLGRSDAPITVVVFSDFQCPFCSRLAGVLEDVQGKHGDKVKIVYKAFPLVSIHKLAMKSALAAFAANAQGMFWEYHDLLMENYRSLSDKKLRKFARDVGLDMKKFELDRKNPNIRKIIRRDMAEARKYNVRGTPTVFVNGKRLRRANKATLENAIKKELE